MHPIPKPKDAQLQESQSPKPTLLVAVTGVVIVVLAKMVVLLVVAMMFVVAVVSTTLHRHLEFKEQPRQHPLALCFH